MYKKNGREILLYCQPDALELKHVSVVQTKQAVYI
jgi:hypothetical protein